jgi:hypothetical protein
MEREGSNRSQSSDVDITALEGHARVLGLLEAEALDLVTVILGHAAILSSRLPATDPGREDVDCIAAAARRFVGVAAAFSQASDCSQPTAPHLS